MANIKLGRCNPKGNFESLYILEDVNNPNLTGDFPESQLKIGDEITVRIFHFNDLHNELRIIHKGKSDTHIFSQMVKIVRDAKAQAADNEIILFVSAGDDHMSNPLDELLGFDVDSFKASAAYVAYSEAGLDASVIGNHELDRGSALLVKAIESNAKFPVLSANLYGSKNLTADHYHPAIIGMAKGLRIGIIGLTTEQKTLIRQKDDPNFDVGDLLVSLKNTISHIAPLSDMIIILSHVGYNGKINGQIRHKLDVGDIEIAQTAASITDKPMLVVGGHMHLKLNEDGLEICDYNVPIVQAGAKGNYLGQVIYSLLKTENALDSKVNANLIRIKRHDTEDDIDIEFEQSVMAPLYGMLDNKLEEIIGVLNCSEDISCSKNLQDRYLGETVIANFMNDAIVAQMKNVDIAAFNASGINGGISANSEISFNDWYQVMPFADTIVIVDMTGQQIKDMLMSNAQRIVRPDELLDLNDYISRGFLHFSSAIRYSIKLNNDATGAVAQDIMLNNKAIDQQLEVFFKVALSDFLTLRGAEGWNNLTNLPQHDTGYVYRNEIIAFIKKTRILDESIVRDGRLNVIS
jgi:2',3'-cyclic-nucleotide 2'-phosphodiesterase (5'-nucleotidase family)